MPQGSVLGPLLFIIYINGLSKETPNSKIILYADDTVIFKHLNPGNPEMKEYNEDLQHITKWCKQHLLSINAKKTKYVLYGTPKQLSKINENNTPRLGEQELVQSKSYIYLGVTLDSHMNMNNHVDNMINLASSKLHTLNHLRKYIGPDVALKMYKTVMLPTLEYANCIVSLFTQTQKSKLQRIQNRALKIIYQVNQRTHTEDLHRRARLNRLTERADKQLLNLMYKRVNNSMYPKETLNGITRQQEKIKFQTERPRCERYKNFPLYYGSKLWDSLASTTQKCENITTFKNQINQIYR